MPNKDRRQVIEAMVNDIISKYALNQPGFDLVAFLVQREAFKVGMQSLKNDITGLLLVNEHEFVRGTTTHNLIVVNSDLAAEPDFLQRRRYITAHEYGHYILHKKGDKIYAHRDYAHKDAPEEKEADYFARCLLMPRELVEKTLSTLTTADTSMGEKISLISRAFNVTEKKARIRLTEDLIN